MTNVNELYLYLENAIPRELSCEWDNDGRMCVPCFNREVKKVLICLDINEDAVDYAAENKFDCIISHHPLIFNPLKNVDAENNVAKKVCKLIKNDIVAFSFHTRLDKVSGGVNDALADIMGLKNTEDFSDVGRMGKIEQVCLKDFAERLKKDLNSDRVICVDGGKKVSKIAVVGGSGKDYLEEALNCGCDTFVTGEVPYNREQDAKEMGINLVCLGHYFTENVVCERLEMLVKNYDSMIYTERFETNPAFTV